MAQLLTQRKHVYTIFISAQLNSFPTWLTNSLLSKYLWKVGVTTAIYIATWMPSCSLSTWRCVRILYGMYDHIDRPLQYPLPLTWHGSQWFSNHQGGGETTCANVPNATGTSSMVPFYFGVCSSFFKSIFKSIINIFFFFLNYTHFRTISASCPHVLPFTSK